jgi:isochorismate synthase EntC
MPYLEVSDHRMQFTGKMAEWINFLQRWYAEDYPDKAIDFQTVYLPALLTYMTTFIKSGRPDWTAKPLFGKSKMEKLEGFFSRDAQGNTKFNVWDVIDYLAENLRDQTFIQDAGSAARQGVIKSYTPQRAARLQIDAESLGKLIVKAKQGRGDRRAPQIISEETMTEMKRTYWKHVRQLVSPSQYERAEDATSGRPMSTADERFLQSIQSQMQQAQHLSTQELTSKYQIHLGIAAAG